MDCNKNIDNSDQTVILGAGLSGLASGYMLAKSGLPVAVLERSSRVGGFAKTFSHNGFLFDLGGHRFLAKNKQLGKFILDLLKDEVLNVHRKSKIYMCQRYFDYPLKPVNAVFGLGIFTTIWVIWDYLFQKVLKRFSRQDIVSLEDWVVHRFGRKMFHLYFKEYSEKVWGIACDRLSMDWVAQRIRGLSLGKAIKNALFKFSGDNLLTPVNGK